MSMAKDIFDAISTDDDVINEDPMIEYVDLEDSLTIMDHIVDVALYTNLVHPQ